jgi:hypothetical protein
LRCVSLWIAILLVCLPAAGQAPCPVLGRGRLVETVRNWVFIQGKIRSPISKGRADLPVGARLESARPVSLAGDRLYRLDMTLRGPAMGRVSVHVVWGKAHGEQLAWPPSTGEGALSSHGSRASAYIVAPASGQCQARFRIVRTDREAKTSTVAVSQVRLFDLGKAPSRDSAVLLDEGFEHWSGPDKPHGYSVAFAKPGQLRPTTEHVHSGRKAARNHGPRAMLFGARLPCRFGTIVRIQLWARGRGRVDLHPIPYLGQHGRHNNLATRSFKVSDRWQRYSFVFVQLFPQCDHLCPAIDIHGPVAIDSLRVETLGTPYYSRNGP